MIFQPSWSISVIHKMIYMFKMNDFVKLLLFFLILAWKFFCLCCLSKYSNLKIKPVRIFVSKYLNLTIQNNLKWGFGFIQTCILCFKWTFCFKWTLFMEIHTQSNNITLRGLQYFTKSCIPSFYSDNYSFLLLAKSYCLMFLSGVLLHNKQK